MAATKAQLGPPNDEPGLDVNVNVNVDVDVDACALKHSKDAGLAMALASRLAQPAL